MLFHPHLLLSTNPPILLLHGLGSPSLSLSLSLSLFSLSLQILATLK